jgi:hypothetical protein
VRLFPFLAVLALALLFVWWFMRTPPERVARILRQALLWVGGALLIFLAASGRLHWLFALFGAAAPFAQRILRLVQFMPLLQRMLGIFHGARTASGPNSGQRSTVRTRFLHMELEHDTGTLSGRVLEGRFKGHKLADLSLEQLLDLLAECSAEDAQSTAVLEAYLDREHGERWREGEPADERGAKQASTDRMTRDEAYEILGLQPGADREQILQAHRLLMQKLHPDRGGSTYLATMINLAKDLLLDKDN